MAKKNIKAVWYVAGTLTVGYFVIRAWQRKVQREGQDCMHRWVAKNIAERGMSPTAAGVDAMRQCGLL